MFIVNFTKDDDRMRNYMCCTDTETCVKQIFSLQKNGSGIKGRKNQTKKDN